MSKTLAGLPLLVVTLLAATAYGAANAFDHAPNPPYGNTMTWPNGSNSGTGWGPWSLTTATSNGTAGFFIGNSGANGGTGNIGSISWGMYANSGDEALALRTFTVGGPNNSAVLAPYQNFSVAMDNGSVATNSTVGFNLLNSLGVSRFTFKFIGGGMNYVYDLGNGVPIDTGVPYTNNGIYITLFLGTENAFTLRMMVREGPTYVVSGTLAASDMDRVQLFNSNAGPGSASDLFFNDIGVGTRSAPVVSNAASRKDHNGTNFDLNLPLTGSPAIESRSGGPTNDYTMVVTFTDLVSVIGQPQAEVIAGTGTVGTGGASNGGAVSSVGNTITIPLTNVVSQQTIQVRLNAVNGGTNITIPMSVLVGDANGDAVVNSGDATVTRNRSGQATDATNFRADYNLDAFINSGDATVVRTRSGQSIPQ